MLASINLIDDGVGVTSGGRFALGPLRGRAAKPEPEYVGATARAERRTDDARVAGDIHGRAEGQTARTCGRVKDLRAGPRCSEDELEDEIRHEEEISAVDEKVRDSELTPEDQDRDWGDSWDDGFRGATNNSSYDEEDELEHRFGREYEAYRRSVNQIVPRIFTIASHRRTRESR